LIVGNYQLPSETIVVKTVEWSSEFVTVIGNEPVSNDDSF